MASGRRRVSPRPHLSAIALAKVEAEGSRLGTCNALSGRGLTAKCAKDAKGRLGNPPPPYGLRRAEENLAFDKETAEAVGRKGGRRGTPKDRAGFGGQALNLKLGTAFVPRRGAKSQTPHKPQPRGVNPRATQTEERGAKKAEATSHRGKGTPVSRIRWLQEPCPDAPGFCTLVPGTWTRVWSPRQKTL